MANIPVEKKSGKGWLWVIIGLIILALLAWWLLDNDGNDTVEYTDNEVVAESTTAAAGAGALAIGESVDLNNVTVASLAGDMAFNIDANGQNMLVLFDQTPTPEQSTEGEYDINNGSVVNIEGEVRSASEPLPQGVTAQIPSGTDRYIYANSIEVVS